MTSKADRPSIVCRVTATGFMPASGFDLELFQAYRLGSDVTIEVKQLRNMKENSKYWRMLGKVVEAVETWPNARCLHTALLIRYGHIWSIQLFNGDTHVEPRSLTDMDDPEFLAYRDWAYKFLCTEVVPGLDLDEFHKGNFVMREDS